MQGLESQKSLISHTQVADLRLSSYACAKKKRLTQIPSSAYNQTVQWAIKGDEDEQEDLWRGLCCLNQQRQEINQ